MIKKTSLVALTLLLSLAAAIPAAAQAPAGDAWRVTVMPYLLGASMSGTAAVKGQEVTIDMSASDIFSNLQFGAMGIVAARKGDWGVAGDAIWMSLGANGTAPGPLGRVTASADMNQGAFAFYGIRRLSPAADLMFGARINTLQANLRLNTPMAVASADGSKTWFDPIVGVQLHTPENGKRWHAQVYTEIGGFGVGSTFTWQVFPTIGVDVSKRASIEFGYRFLDIDYSTGENATLFRYDVLTQGPVMGFRFKF
ncbi:MAG: hypothetical protein NTY02_15675 [Acidobacteria bacterium]|nr:hypothetical protein [Acidobacteriota bacterium]